MDVGLFIPVANNGWIISTNSPLFMPSARNRQVAERAETYSSNSLVYAGRCYRC
jgi:pyrimidine oxygenase